MDKNNEQTLRRIVQMRALRLGVSEEEILALASDTAAQYEGPSAEVVLEADLRALLDSEYPSPQCSMPYQIEEYEEFSLLPEERLQHVHGCDFCSMLMKLAKPDPEKVRVFLDKARTLSKMRVQTSATVSTKARIA